MRNRGAGFAEAANFFVVEVDAVGEPGIAPKPATILKIVERTHPERCETEIVFVLCFSKMCVQSNA